MTKFEVGPTGKLLKGHVFDVRKESLETALQNYDPFLYLTWNPEKRRKLGCWELRRRPEQKTAVNMATYKGQDLYLLASIENDLVNHVVDVPFLTYQLLDDIKRMDAWGNKHWVADFEASERDSIAAHRAKATSEMRYNLKQDRKLFREFKEMVASGLNPAAIARHWK